MTDSQPCPECGGEMPDDPIERCNTCARWGSEVTLSDISGIVLDGQDAKIISRIFRREECSLPINDDGTGREHGLCNPHKDAKYWKCKCGHEEKVR